MKTNLFMCVGLLMLLTTNTSLAQIQSAQQTESVVQSETLSESQTGAQTSSPSAALSGEIDSEIDQMSQPVRKVKSQQGGAVTTQVMSAPRQAIQKQPTTVVEASPLSDSRADNIRRNRQDEELRTESKIVEKLEQSRMEDEKKRAAVLFGDKFESLQNKPSQQSGAAQPVQVSPSQVPPAQPIVIQQNETLTRDAVREEVRAALSEDSKAVTVALEQKYFAGIAGIAQYPDIKAIQGNYSLGAAFGTRFDYLMVEGSFLLSNYGILGASYLDYNNFVRLADFEMNQYQGALAAKYQLLGGMVRPVLGGMMSYSYRKYSSTTATTFGAAGTEFGSSHAIDLGVIAGIDLEFNDKMSLGVDMKYLFNMSSRINGSSVAGAVLPEKAQYYITGLSARVNF